MLIHHFETQGFQGLIGHNDRGKAFVSEKSHFPKETFFWGGSGLLNFSERRLGISQCISLMKIFLFLI